MATTATYPNQEKTLTKYAGYLWQTQELLFDQKKKMETMIANFKILLLIIAGAALSACTKKCVVCKRDRICYSCVKGSSNVQLCSDDYVRISDLDNEAQAFTRQKYTCTYLQSGTEEEKICDMAIYSGQTFIEQENNGYDCGDF